jgi:OOP family OmpA-OmpF porin
MSIARMAAAAVAAVTIASLTGCATKKFVSARVDPIERRIESLEKQNKDQEASIEELDRGVSRANERAVTADNRSQEASREAINAKDAAARAGDEAKRAAADATSASSTAGGARSMAEQSLGKAGDVERRMERFDNFQLVTSETVLFGLGSSRLSKEGEAALDGLAGQLASKKRFVIEIQGFTDTTGSAALNLELSRQRANAVARYLTTKHKVAVHRIHMLGLGSDVQVADNKTREGRKQNRRVEVKLLEADLGAAATTASAVSGTAR